jgi:hypothetical protein
MLSEPMLRVPLERREGLRATIESAPKQADVVMMWRCCSVVAGVAAGSSCTGSAVRIGRSLGAALSSSLGRGAAGLPG